MTKRYVLVPLLALSLGSVLDSRTRVADCFSTPQATISAYWHRMIEHRHADALECFVEGTGDVSGMLALPDLVELRPRDFVLHWRHGGIVDVGYAVEYRVAMGDSLRRFPTGDQLQLTGVGWKIGRPLLVASHP